MEAHPEYMNAVFERDPENGVTAVYESRDPATGGLYHWVAVIGTGDSRRGVLGKTRREALDNARAVIMGGGK